MQISENHVLEKTSHTAVLERESEIRHEPNTLLMMTT
jgi:hypothetical protein